MEELQRLYKLLHHEVKKVQQRINRLDIIIEHSDRLNADYWRDVRAEAVAYLNGISKAADIIFKELHK